ncbi:hypothetical protein ALO_20817 [Acetonema longum DSM 6540]|uniref:Uncharacterized protein n=1 Tax=Acetonema longum DSM 6540 TaxID=1009370 RepID=F7NPW6_9FIRM|nr:hypothetical protein ALO_20817 [Acetonema longum DSM 6540]
MLHKYRSAVIHAQEALKTAKLPKKSIVFFRTLGHCHGKLRQSFIDNPRYIRVLAVDFRNPPVYGGFWFWVSLTSVVRRMERFGVSKEKLYQAYLQASYRPVGKRIC